MSEWQPIETAPNDGRWVIVAIEYDTLDDYPFCGVCQFRRGQWQILVDENTNYLSDTSFGSPTHWMPLPNPPK